MNLLVFDTATNACTVALQVGDRVLSRHKIAPREHASLILQEIQALCDEAAFDLTQLDAIAFGCGPGSFMGVRLATAMAQGLAFGLKIPVIEISTLQILAQTAFEKSGARQLLAGWDARMGEIYWGFYEINAAGLAEVKLNDCLSIPSQVDIDSLGEIAFSLVGNAWEVYETSLREKAALTLTHLYPEATAMLTLAQAKYLAHERVSPASAHPHYIRHHVANNHK